MHPESSPFSPGRPAPPEFFIGRKAEIERLHGMAKASAAGRLQVGFVTGERGIGKSSLVSFVRHLADRDSSAAGCHVYLGGVESLENMLGRTCEQLLRESVDKPWHEKIVAFFGDRVRKVGLFGVTLELALAKEDLATLSSNFATSIQALAERLDERKAILLILDDINGLAASRRFAHWLKSLVDELATSNRPVPLCIVVAGHEERRRELIANQPSLGRVFELIDIAPWSDGETRAFFGTLFGKSDIELSSEALDMMVYFSGGLPVLAHEIGDAVWRLAPQPSQQAINRKTAAQGVMRAAEIIGLKLVEPQVFSALRSEQYRSILAKLAESLPDMLDFSRADLKEQLAQTEGRVLDRFLKRMRDLGVIEADPNHRGRYRFANLLHALYISTRSIGGAGRRP